MSANVNSQGPSPDLPRSHRTTLQTGLHTRPPVPAPDPRHPHPLSNPAKHTHTVPFPRVHQSPRPLAPSPPMPMLSICPRPYLALALCLSFHFLFSAPSCFALFHPAYFRPPPPTQSKAKTRFPGPSLRRISTPVPCLPSPTGQNTHAHTHLSPSHSIILTTLRTRVFFPPDALCIFFSGTYAPISTPSVSRFLFQFSRERDLHSRLSRVSITSSPCYILSVLLFSSGLDLILPCNLSLMCMCVVYMVLTLFH